MKGKCIFNSHFDCKSALRDLNYHVVSYFYLSPVLCCSVIGKIPLLTHSLPIYHNPRALKILYSLNPKKKPYATLHNYLY